MRNSVLSSFVGLFLAFALAFACDNSGGTGTSGGGGATGATGGNSSGDGAAGANGDGAPGDSGQAGTGQTGSGGMFQFSPTPEHCPVSPAQCSNGMDDDRDGLIDAEDPECTGPCDHVESTFATGIPGDNVDDLRSCRQDCFYDGNSGGGAGDCQWDLRCDPLRADSAQCRYAPDSSQVRCPATQSEQCLRTCRNLTPNGCDCFGCCSVPGQTYGVLLTSTCTTAPADLADPQKCMRCTPAPSCINPCERCEICFGKPAPDPSCAQNPGYDGGAPPDGSSSYPAPQCPPGFTTCGPGGQVPTNGCPAPSYCITGCCITQVD